MVRGIIAVVVGFSLWTALWLGAHQVLLALFPAAYSAGGTTESTGLLLGYWVISMLVSAIAGYTTAAIATEQRQRFVFILAGLFLIVGVLVQISSWALMPAWYHIAFLVMLAPCTILGGRLKGV